MSITEDLISNIVDTKFDSIPKDTVDRAKWRIIDSLGCLIAGSKAAGCPGLVDLVKGWGGASQGSILTHKVKVPAHNAAMANSVMTRSFDFEPVEAEGETHSSPAHISGTTVPTAVTVAEWQGTSGRDLLEALILGDDLVSRIGVASGFDFGLGWDNTGTMNGFGATAIASKLLKLNAGQIANAFGIVLNQFGGTMDSVWDKVMTFKLCMALAAKNGVFSAELASHGYTGVKDPILGQHGYFMLYCLNHDTSNLTKDLGKRFYADRVIKPYSACRATHSSIDSALAISLNNDLKIDEIEHITVKISPGTFSGFTGQPFIIQETPQIDGAFSIRYTVATALLRKGVKPAYFADEYIHDPIIRRLIDRMELLPAMPDRSPATEINVKMSDGTLLTGTTSFPKGDIERTPLTKDDIRAKFRANRAYSEAVPSDKAEEALALLEKLEEIDDIRKVTELLS